MPAFATVTQLAEQISAATQAEIDAGAPGMSTSQAQQALDNASADIRSFLQWAVTQETITGAVLDGSGQRSLWLPTLHLTAVASVAEGGVTLLEGTDFTWTSHGRLIRSGTWLPYPRNVVATWTHGYPADSWAAQECAAVCLELAADIMQNPTGRRSSSVSVDDYSESWTAAGGSEDLRAGLTDAQRKRLDWLKLPTI